MYRVLAVVGGALTLAACSSTPDWMSLDGLKPAPAVDTVRLESTPPGAEAKASSGQTCRTPCSLALPASGPVTVTFTLAGYVPESETLEIIQDGAMASLRPNPVAVELTPAPPSNKPAAKKPAAKKPAAKKPATSQAPATPAAAAAPAQQGGASPWPSTPAR